MTEEEYRKLVDRAFSQLSPATERKERFEIPRTMSSVSGTRTILTNFKEICDRLKRNRNQVLKYIAGELATSGTVDGSRVIFQGKFSNHALEQLINKYVNEFVYCPVCHQPDTKIVRKDRIYFLACEACGASSSIRGI